MAETICDLCNLTLDSRGVGSHRGSLVCRVRADQARVVDEALIRVPSPHTVERLRDRGVEILSLYTSYVQGNRGRRAKANSCSFVRQAHAALLAEIQSPEAARKRASVKRALAKLEPLRALFALAAAAGEIGAAIERGDVAWLRYRDGEIVGVSATYRSGYGYPGRSNYDRLSPAQMVALDAALADVRLEPAAE